MPHFVHIFAGLFGIIDKAISPMKGVIVDAAMMYRRRFGTRRVYMPTIRKRQSDTTGSVLAKYIKKLESGSEPLDK
jgi:hypothetical protein